jgi:hypothetical protein
MLDILESDDGISSADNASCSRTTDEYSLSENSSASLMSHRGLPHQLQAVISKARDAKDRWTRQLSRRALDACVVGTQNSIGSMRPRENPSHPNGGTPLQRSTWIQAQTDELQGYRNLAASHAIDTKKKNLTFSNGLVRNSIFPVGPPIHNTHSIIIDTGIKKNIPSYDYKSAKTCNVGKIKDPLLNAKSKSYSHLATRSALKLKRNKSAPNHELY